MWNQLDMIPMVTKPWCPLNLGTRTVPIRPGEAERAVRMLSREPPIPWTWVEPVVMQSKPSTLIQRKARPRPGQEDSLPSVGFPPSWHMCTSLHVF